MGTILNALKIEVFKKKFIEKNHFIGTCFENFNF